MKYPANPPHPTAGATGNPNLNHRSPVAKWLRSFAGPLLSRPTPGMAGAVVCACLACNLATAATIYWTGDNGSNWDTGTTNSNWSTSSGSNVDYGKRPQASDIVEFGYLTTVGSAVNYTATVGGIVFHDVHNLSGSSITLNGNLSALSNPSGHNYAVTINNNIVLGTDSVWDIVQSGIFSSFEMAGTISGSHQLTKQGVETLMLQAANTYTGGTIIDAGTIELGVNNALPSGRPVTINNASLVLGAYNQTVGALALSGTGEITATTGTLTLGGNVTGETTTIIAHIDDTYATITGNVNLGGATRQFTVSDTGADTMLISADIAGTGGLIKTGAGTMTLSGTNTYTGSTTINQGSLYAAQGNAIPDGSAVVLANAVDTQLRVASGQTEAIGSLEGGGTTGGSVMLDSGSTLIFGTNNLSKTYSGVISGTDVQLVKTGSGTQTLAGQSTMTGSVQINQASLKLGASDVFYTYESLGREYGVDVSIATGASLNLNNFSATIGALAGTGGVVLGSGDLTLLVQGGGWMPDVTFPGAISGSGRLIKRGDAPLTLTGANTYSGGTVIRRGQVVATTSTITGDISLEPETYFPADMIFEQNTDGTYSGVVSGDGGLTKKGTGRVTLSGANTFNKALSIWEGTVRLSGGAAVSNTTAVGVGLTGTLELGANEEIGEFSGGGQLKLNSYYLTFGDGYSTYGGDITGTGGLIIKAGNDGMSLEGSCSYSGGTTLLDGQLSGDTSSLQGNIQNFGTVRFSQYIDGTYSGTMSGSGGLDKWANGTLTLAGPNTFTGKARVTAGTLRLGTGNILSDTVTVWVDAGATLDLYDTNENIGALYGEGTVNLGLGDLGLMNSNDITFAGTIIGSGSLVKHGGGILELLGANTYTGGTILYLGTLRGNTSSLQGNITNNSAVVFAQATSGTYAGAMSGSGSLTLEGAGPLILTGANSHAGGTIINAGALQIGNGGSAGSLAGNVVNNGSLTINRSGTITLGGNISGSGTLTKLGTGTLILTGANTYAGGTTVSTGTLRGSATSLQGDIDNDGAVVFDQATTGTFSDRISGSGTLTKTGAGTLILSNTSTYTGGTTISQGTLQVGTGGSKVGAITGDVLDNAALTFSYLGTHTFAGMISGTGNVTKTGTGTLNLTATNSYTGGTTISAGMLGIGSDANLGGNSGSLALNGGTLKSTASFGISSFRSIILTDNDGTFDTNGFDTTVPAISGTGSLTKTGLGTLVLAGPNTYAGGTLISQGTLQLGTGGTTGSIDGNVTNNANLTINRSSAHTYGGVISGTGSLTKTGTCTFMITGTNTYSGGTTISQGVLQVGGSGTTGSIAGNVTDNASLVFNRSDVISFGGNISGSGSVTMIGAGTLRLTGASTYSGGTIIDQGTLQVGDGGTTGSLAGDVSNSTNLAFNRSNAYTFAGFISGTGTVTQSGTGALELTAANTYTGGTTVTAGSIRISSDANLGATSSPLTLDDGTIDSSAAFSFSAARSIVLAAGNGTFHTNGLDTTIASVVSGTGSLTKTGSGSLVLTGSNSYGGGTVISQGTLQLGNGGTTGSLTGDILDNANFSYNRSNTYTFPGIISGTGTLTKSGTGTLLLTGPNSYAGGTILNQGTLQVGSGSTTGSITGDVVNNSNLTFNRSDTFTYGGAISGAGTLTKTGAGTMVLTGLNTHGGASTINQGTLQIGSGGSTGHITGNIVNNANLTFNRANTINYGGIISGGGTVTQNGAGILELSGLNTYTGTTVLNAGIIQIDNNADLGATSADLTLNGGILRAAGPVTLGSGRSLLFNAGGGTFDTNGFGLIIAGSSSGTGNLIKVGTGTLNLAGTSTRSGKAYLNAGTVEVSFVQHLGGIPASYVPDLVNFDGGALRTTNSTSFSAYRGITLNAGHGTFDVADTTTLSVFSPIIGPGGFTKTGLGTMELNGSNTFAGAVQISQGTLSLAGDNLLPATTRIVLSAGGVLDLADRSQTLASLTGMGSVSTQSGPLTLNNSSDVVFAGTITGTGNLAKVGSGVLILGGSNSHTGLSSIQQGTLRLGNHDRLSDASDVSIATGAFLDLNGFSEAIDGLSGTGTVMLNGGTLAVGAGDSTAQYDGTFVGNGGLSKIGFGTFTVTGNSTYTGPTAVSAGILRVGSSTALGMTTQVAVDSGATVSFATPTGADWEFTSPITGRGNLEKTGPGTLTLATDSTYGGATTITEGTLRINDTLHASGQAIELSPGATLEASGVIRRDLMGNGHLVLTDTLMVGSLSGSGVHLYGGGSADIGAYELAVIGRYQAMLDQATLAGGTLSSLHGVMLTGELAGYGEVVGQLTNNGSVVGGGGSQALHFLGPVDGMGSFAGNVEFHNSYSPGLSPAAVSFGNLTLANPSLLLMELGGTTPDSQYDKLLVGGGLKLSGTMSVSLINSFQPAAGNSFDLFDWSSVTGTFSSLNLPSLTSGLVWDTSDLYTTGTLEVVYETPPAPTDLMVTQQPGLSLRIEWSDTSPPAAGFEVQRALDSGFSVGLTTLSLPAGQTSYVDTGRTPETTCHYRVRALGTPDPSDYSTPAWAATPTRLADWRWVHFGNQNPVGEGADNQDPDHDGAVNLMEYACNLNPHVADASALADDGTAGLPGVVVTPDGHLQITFLRRPAASLPTITQGVVFSNNLSTWSTESGAATSVQPINDLWERVVLTDPAPAAAHRFARTMVTAP